MSFRFAQSASLAAGLLYAASVAAFARPSCFSKMESMICRRRFLGPQLEKRNLVPLLVPLCTEILCFFVRQRAM